MRKHKLYLNRFISTEDIVFVFGEWKLHSPEMFEEGKGEELEISQALIYLRE